MKIRMDDGAVVDTLNTAESWDEATCWDGNNTISVATGKQFFHQRLHRSRKHRYYLESWTDMPSGHRPTAIWLSKKEAVAWLLANERDVPADLEDLAEEVEE